MRLRTLARETSMHAHALDLYEPREPYTAGVAMGTPVPLVHADSAVVVASLQLGLLQQLECSLNTTRAVMGLPLSVLSPGPPRQRRHA